LRRSIPSSCLCCRLKLKNYNKISMTHSEPRSIYSDAIAHLNALIPELFTAPGQVRRKFSLGEIGALSAGLGYPHRRYPSVLIAGTNGKGSTAATLASIARESGLRVGLYTSPHLDRVNERIRLLVPSGSVALEVGGVGVPFHPDEISDEDFGRLYFQVQETAERLVREGALPGPPSFFEVLTALAFVYFAESEVDLAVLEVGMGGRLDATNLVDPVISVITDISLDHQEWLGSTIDLIAREKAGILRAGGVLVTLPQHPEANQAIGEVATGLGVRGVNAAEFTPPMGTGPNEPYMLEVLGGRIVVDSPLKGAHQHRNIALAVAAAVELSRDGEPAHDRAPGAVFPITAAAIERGIHNTRWPGRLERIAFPGWPEFLLDVAHNPAGAWALRAALSAGSAASAPGVGMNAGYAQVLIFACLRDKPLREMTQILFPVFDHVVLAPIHSPRATEVAELAAAAEATGVPSTPAATVMEAIEIARSLASSGGSSSGGRVVISGSVYLVGEARALLLAERSVEIPQEVQP
jgi:dihydrofolate synthase / folylpolyglutamate synthase